MQLVYYTSASHRSTSSIKAHTMKLVGCLFVIFLNIYQGFSKDTADCTDVPTTVSSLLSLERSILCDEYNVQSLTEAFYPANRRPALIVLVSFYVNSTVHPLSLPPSTISGTDNNVSIGLADYAVFWFSSSVLDFIEPRLLEGLSLRTYTAEYNFAHIRIAPFIYNDTSWIRGLLTNATIWLKSYAERRSISISEGMDPSSQGFSAYKPDVRRDDYFVFNPPVFYQAYVLLLALSFAFIVVSIGAGTAIIIMKNYHQLHELSKKGKSDQVSFSFHNLFWGLILAFGISLLAIYFFSIWNIVTFGFKWDTVYSFIYPALTCGLIVSILLSVLVALFAIRKVTANDMYIAIPRLLYRVFGIDHSSITTLPMKGTLQRKIIALWQILGVFIVQNIVVLLAFFSCGILIALFVDPVQVITTLAIYISAFLCLTHGFAVIFEATGKIEKSDTNRGIISAAELFLKLFFIVTGSISVTLFIVVFGFSFASIVFFIGTSDQLELFSSVGELLPVAVASAIGWLLRREFKSYTKEDANVSPSHNKQHLNDADPIVKEMTEIAAAEPH